MVFEKEIKDFLQSFVKEFFTSVETDVSDRISRIIQTKIVKPLDRLGRRLMYGFTAAIMVSLGIVAVALSVLVFLYYILTPGHLALAFAVVGVLLLIAGVVFSSKMASLNES
ncbi:MAG: hypothetical protein ABH950_06050 [Candidatus Altiarchaeota archaeon]